MIDAQNTPHSYRVEQLSNGQRGRPRFNVPREQLEFLIERGFSIPDIAHILGISVRTIERRLLQFGLSATQAFTSIDNQSLDHTIQDIVRNFPSFGYQRMTGALLSRGIRVRQVRIRDAMRRVNPEGVLLRALTINTVNRRKYQVHSPLSLWNIAGNHKLIRLVRQSENNLIFNTVFPKYLHVEQIILDIILIFNYYGYEKDKNIYDLIYVCSIHTAINRIDFAFW